MFALCNALPIYLEAITMNKYLNSAFLGLTAIIVSGCSHITEVSSVRATNVYSNHEGKILRTVSYTVDGTSLNVAT